METIAGEGVSSDTLPIITIDEINSTISVIRQKEEQDQNVIVHFLSLSDAQLREKIIEWAMAGFADNYVLHSMQFTRLNKCSDGVSRSDVLNYIDYIRPSFSISDTLSALETRLPDMKLSYSYGFDFTLRVHISRKTV